MKKIYVFGLVLLLAAAMALPASAAMWFGGELGANWIGSTDLKISGGGGNDLTIQNAKFGTSVIGGVTLGYDFVNSGFLGYAYPDWMKYFGFAIDYTYNRVTIPNQTRSVSFNGVTVGNANLFPFGSKSNGSLSALTFLFYGHYGFFPDSEVPSGRVHPYIGVGPAIAWLSLDGGPFGVGSSTATNVALVVEPGIRFMALPNVSIDLSFRYRYFTPTNSFSTPAGDIDIKSTINSFSFLTRVAYHF